MFVNFVWLVLFMLSVVVFCLLFLIDFVGMPISWLYLVVWYVGCLFGCCFLSLFWWFLIIWVCWLIRLCLMLWLCLLFLSCWFVLFVYLLLGFVFDSLNFGVLMGGCLAFKDLLCFLGLGVVLICFVFVVNLLFSFTVD